MREEVTFGEEGYPVSGHLPIHPIIAGGGHGRNTVYCQPVDKRFSYLKLSYLLGWQYTVSAISQTEVKLWEEEERRVLMSWEKIKSPQLPHLKEVVFGKSSL